VLRGLLAVQHAGTSVYMLNKGPGAPYDGTNVGGGTTVHMAQVRGSTCTQTCGLSRSVTLEHMKMLVETQSRRAFHSCTGSNALPARSVTACWYAAVSLQAIALSQLGLILQRIAAAQQHELHNCRLLYM
jgi:hypothetical protein